MVFAKNLEELRAYREAFSLQQEVFEKSKTFPDEEKYSLTSQIRRSSRSVSANLAEAWQKRRYVKEFKQKLSIADAELVETRHWLNTANSCGYLSETTAIVMKGRVDLVGKMIGKMLLTADMWKVHFEKCGY